MSDRRVGGPKARERERQRTIRARGNQVDSLRAELDASREAGQALRDIVAKLDAGFATVTQHAEWSSAVQAWDEAAGGTS